jgi:anti-sigma B factor antagonist
MDADEQELLRIAIDTVDGPSPVVVLSGELDLSNAETLSDCLTKLIDTDTDVVIDMSDLRSIDSSGLTALARARHRAELRGRVITVRRPGSMGALVLAITHLDRLFTIEQ